ncbi:MAG: diaminobutyrate--2-oxoglutarate transaminase [Magnetospirillum sp.]
METFDTLESSVRSYIRDFPAVFAKASGHFVHDEEGRRYIDFFAGAGVLNYGHNNPRLKQALLDYLAGDGIVHSLDMATVAKRDFLETFDRLILKPRGLDYRLQFPGPTGTNAVEAALKLARKVTGRHLVIGFTNGFHGMTLGSLAVTGNGAKRGGAGVPLTHTMHMPFCGYHGAGVDTLTVFERYLADNGSGIDLPAAVIVETVQGEGGINVGSVAWLKKLEQLCRRHDILLIVDDIQMGCGRTGPFFSFELAGLKPDIVCLSKSIGAIGLPMALTLIAPHLDQWAPGEHNGTFRGNNAAFVAAAEALRAYWADGDFQAEILRKGQLVRDALDRIAATHPGGIAQVRGRGLIQGLVFAEDGMAEKAARAAFAEGVIIETSGPKSEVLKVMPPLTIDDDALCQGLDVLARVVAALTPTKQSKAA